MATELQGKFILVEMNFVILIILTIMKMMITLMMTMMMVVMPDVLNEASQLLDSGLAEQIMADAEDEDMGDR